MIKRLSKHAIIYVDATRGVLVIDDPDFNAEIRLKIATQKKPKEKVVYRENLTA